MALFLAVFSLVLFLLAVLRRSIDGAGQENLHFDLLVLMGPHERYPVGTLLVSDLEGEAFP